MKSPTTTDVMLAVKNHTLISLVWCSILLGSSGYAQGSGRYWSEIFPSHTLQSNIQYGTTTTHMCDVYTGTGDTASMRPLVVFIHGGGFKSGDKVSNFGTRVCGGLARRGYVVASINYRLTYSIPNDVVQFEAMLRALQDAKAAVRYFRKNWNHFGIDTSQIYATGSSAGSITALHLAYLDSSEVPAYVTWGNVGGSFDGTSGNPGFDSRIQGVISNWGAIGDTLWMQDRDAPVYCVHGTSDVTVYFDSIPADGPFLYGSKHIYHRAAHLGLPAGLRPFYATGHTLDNNATKQDSAIKDFSSWLAAIVDSHQLPSGVREEGSLLPHRVSLLSVYPNPFNPSTVIEYRLKHPGRVTLAVYDVLGARVSTLVDEYGEPGKYSVSFDGTDRSSGVYYCQIVTTDAVDCRPMILSR